MSNHLEPCKFGLIAGLGVGAGIFYYRSLMNAHLARGLIPNILMVHAHVRRVMAHAAARETQELAAYLNSDASPTERRRGTDRNHSNIFTSNLRPRAA